MKKLLVFAMALALVALALPAFAEVSDNDINGNAGAIGNTQGVGNNQNNQFNGAVFGDKYDGGAVNGTTFNVNNNGAGNNIDNSQSVFMNKSTLDISGNGSNNDIDNSGAGSFLNKSAVVVAGTGNDNWIGNQAYFINLQATDSVNNNVLYLGSTEHAWQNQYQNTHQFDHQLNFPTTFQDSTDAAIFMPINPVHLSQNNTGMNVGDYAGAALAASAVGFNATGANISGMYLGSANTGGVAQNQAAANVVTAFSR